jgi:MFS family permease
VGHFGFPKIRSPRIGLAVLTFINLFNYLDRYVVSALAESLKKSELSLSDTQLGLLMTGFVIVYMLTSPFFGALGDRYSRTRLIAFGVAIWSLATAMAGLTGRFITLFLARATVGIGEAAYGTIAPALLADYYPKHLRGRVFAVFFAAIPIGSALGYVLGGVIDKHFGWRAAFYVAGLPGLVLAALTLSLFDPPRGAQDEKDAPTVGGHGPSPSGGWRSYAELWHNRPYVLTVLGYAAYTFALGGIAFWMPTFLERMRGVPKEAATVQFGTIVVITGFLGTFAGGWLGDYFLRYTKQAYLLVSGVSALAAAPFALIALVAPAPSVYLSAIVVAEILIFASTGPINSAVVNLVAPGMRATAVAATNFTIHILGDVPSPPLIGAISDATSLDKAVLLVPMAVAVGGTIWLYAALRA